MWKLDGPKRDYNCMISVYSNDGSLSVSHGGIEIGQGIHTKISQVCAYQLGIPMDIISVKHPNTNTNPNINPDIIVNPDNNPNPNLYSNRI